MDTRGKRNQPVQYVPAAGPQKGPKKRHSTEGNTPAAGPQKGPPKRHSTEGNTPAAGEQKGPPKRHSSEGNTPAASPQKPKKTRKNRNTQRNAKWNHLRVDQHQRRIGMEHYKKPAWLDKTDALDLSEYEKHFQSLNQGQLCSSIVFFLSVLFSVIHSWKPDRSFRNYCPMNTSPARALCFLNTLRLTEKERKGMEKALQQDVAYGALTAINQSEESKKNLPAEPEDSAAKKEKNNLNRRPLEEIVPIMHGTFKKMLFKFVTQQWSAVLRDENWNGWEEFKEYFGSMHFHGHCWGWKKRDIQYEAWDELKAWVVSDPCCEDLRAKTYSPEELDEAQARLIAYVRKGEAEEPQTQSSSWKSAPISTEPPGSASNEAAREETPPDAETTVINQAMADINLWKEEQKVNEINEAMKLLENAKWLMKAPHDHKNDFDALIEMSRKFQSSNNLKDIHELRQTASSWPTSLRAYAILPFLALQKLESDGKMPMIIHNLSDRGIRKQAGECDYHDPGNVAVDFSYFVLQLWNFVLPTKHSSANQVAWRPYGDTKERSGIGAMNRRGNMIEALLSNAIYNMKKEKQRQENAGQEKSRWNAGREGRGKSGRKVLPERGAGQAKQHRSG